MAYEFEFAAEACHSYKRPESNYNRKHGPLVPYPCRTRATRIRSAWRRTGWFTSIRHSTKNYARLRLSTGTQLSLCCSNALPNPQHFIGLDQHFIVVKDMKGNLNVGKPLTHLIIIPIHDPAIKNNNSYPPRNTSISTQSLPSLLSILFVANHSYSISPPLHINAQNTMYILRSNYRVPTAKDHYFGASCLSDSPIGSKLNWKRTWLLIYIRIRMESF